MPLRCWQLRSPDICRLALTGDPPLQPLFVGSSTDDFIEEDEEESGESSEDDDPVPAALNALRAGLGDNDRWYYVVTCKPRGSFDTGTLRTPPEHSVHEEPPSSSLGICQGPEQRPEESSSRSKAMPAHSVVM
jgi:hypothetical protein